MSFSDLFGSGEHVRNLGHFATMVHLALIDGEINEQEEAQLQHFAVKLDISEDEYKKVIENPTAFPIQPPDNYERRLERLHDLFKIIFADSSIHSEETYLLKKYAIGLGFSTAISEAIINRSIQIFTGQLNFDDYKYLVEKKQD